jgi:NADH-quinone oxidoreductase subunit E
MDFEVKGVECLGACGYTMMQLGDFYKEHLTRKNRSTNS